jgi:aspartate 1-decarboxylase
MLLEFCKSKIAHGFVTEAELHYEGSITIDEDLINAVNIFPGEKVEVLNMNNGNRFYTYVIAGKAGSGRICLNGPAARLGLVGDQLIVLSYALMTPEEAKNHKIKVIYLGENNKIKNQQIPQV